MGSRAGVSQGDGGDRELSVPMQMQALRWQQGSGLTTWGPIIGHHGFY